MAKKFIKLTTIRCFPNNDGQAKSKYGNSKWKPFKDGSPADIHLRADQNYSVSGFINDDGSIGISIRAASAYQAGDSISDGVSQGGFKPIAESVQAQHHPKTAPIEDLDDSDIPF